MFALAESGLYSSALDGTSWELEKDDFSSPPLDIALYPGKPGVVLIATVEGVLRSTDGGATFAQRTLDRQSSRSRIETSQDGSAAYFSAGMRIFRSLDDGISWEERAAVPGPASAEAIYTLRIDPVDAATVYANAYSRVFVSRDGAGSWRALTTPAAVSEIFDFVVDGSDPQRVLEATDKGLFISDDGGTTWSEPRIEERVFAVGVDPTGGAIYAAIVHEGHRILKSEDGGSSWQDVLVQPTELGFPGLAIDPTRGETIAAFGGDGVFISTDSGGTWTARAGGIDGGSTWSESSGGLPEGAHVDAIATTSTYGVLYASGHTDSFEHGIYRTLDGGVTWSATGAPSSELFLPLSVDPRDPDVVYTSIGDHLAKTTDGGTTWTIVASTSGELLCCDFRQVVFDPTNARVLFALAANDVLRSVDGGATWERLVPYPYNFTFRTLSLELAPSNPSTLLLGVDGFGIRQMTIAPDLALTLTAPSSLSTGTRAEYTLTVVNHGPFDATNLEVTVEFPGAAASVSAVSPGGTCTIANATATCRYDLLRADSLPEGAEPVTIFASAVPAEPGDFAVSASVTADQPDANKANDSATSLLNVDGPLDPPPASSNGGGGGGGGGGASTVLDLLALLCALLTSTRAPRRPACLRTRLRPHAPGRRRP